MNEKNSLDSFNKIIFVFISIVSALLFVFTGFGVLFFAPMAFVFSCIYSSIFIILFNKYKTPTVFLYLVAATLFLGYMSIMLNVGIVSDSSKVEYLIPGLVDVPSDSFNNLFKTLLQFSILYICVSTALNISYLKSNKPKRIFIVLLLGLFILSIHFGFFLLKYPNLKLTEDNKTKIAKNIEKEILLDVDDFNLSKVINTVYTNRLAYAFKPPHIYDNNTECLYLSSLLDASLDTSYVSYFSGNCLNDSFKALGGLPLSSKNTVEYSLNLNEGKKGDILGIVVELPKNSRLSVCAEGNIVYDYYKYKVPKDRYIDIGCSSYEEVATTEYLDTKNTVILLYPINVDGLKKIPFVLSKVDLGDHSELKLKEVFTLNAYKFSEPEWLKERMKNKSMPVLQ